MRPYSKVVSAKNVLMTDLGPIGSLDSPVIKQIAQLSNPYSGVFSISRPTVCQPVSILSARARNRRTEGLHSIES